MILYVGELYMPEVDGSQVVMDGAVIGGTYRDVTGTVTRMKIWFDGKLISIQAIFPKPCAWSVLEQNVSRSRRTPQN